MQFDETLDFPSLRDKIDRYFAESKIIDCHQYIIQQQASTSAVCMNKELSQLFYYTKSSLQINTTSIILKTGIHKSTTRRKIW